MFGRIAVFVALLSLLANHALMGHSYTAVDHPYLQPLEHNSSKSPDESSSLLHLRMEQTPCNSLSNSKDLSSATQLAVGQDGMSATPANATNDLYSTTAPAGNCPYTQLTRNYDLSHPDNKLDLYVPDAGATSHPLILYIHGGGFVGGDRSMIDSGFIQAAICRGYVIASVDYRLADVASYPAAVQDIKAAIRYLRGNSTELSIDPLRIGVMGHSAGGHLASLVAASNGASIYENPAQGYPEVSSFVQAGVGMSGSSNFKLFDLPSPICGGTGMTPAQANDLSSRFLGCDVTRATAGAQSSADRQCFAKIIEADPASHLGVDSAPLMLVHGTNDCIVPIVHSEVLFEKLTTAGIATELVRHINGHGLGGVEADMRILDFLDTHLKAETPSIGLEPNQRTHGALQLWKQVVQTVIKMFTLFWRD